MRTTPIEWDAARWSNFKPDEGANANWPHSGLAYCDPDFIDKVQRLREMCGFPLGISSAYRSPNHNKAVSDTGANGPHTTGRAVDILVSHERADKLLEIVYGTRFAKGYPLFTGVGIKQHGDNRFVHLDDLERPDHPRPITWSYR